MGNCYTKLFVVKQENNFQEDRINRFLDKYVDFLDKIDQKRKDRILAILLMNLKHIPIELIKEYNSHVLGV